MSDSTGTQLAAMAWPVTQSLNTEVWTSVDAGVTWTKRVSIAPASPSAEPQPSLASDSTGTRLVVAWSDVWTSSDAGLTWTDQAANPPAVDSWFALASDASGDHLIAIGVTADSEDIWTSADGGKSWTDRTQGISSVQWMGVASDATGTHLTAISYETYAPLACPYPGYVWTSADSGATWVNQTKATAVSGQAWVSVASDATGANLIAANPITSSIWRSTDWGATWTNETAGTVAGDQQFGLVASNATGTRLIAISHGEYGPADVNGLCCQGSIWIRDAIGN
jgi:hypothetical protein